MSTRFIAVHALVAALCLATLSPPAMAVTDEESALPQAAAWLRDRPRLPLWIISPGARCLRFNVWVAQSAEEFSRGLMYVRRLESDGGMLFAMQAEREISMWMRNTVIPLDLLFADASGRIFTIHENAEPLSLAHRSSEGLASAVLELPGGTVARLGIAIGDRIRHAHFGTSGCSHNK